MVINYEEKETPVLEVSKKEELIEQLKWSKKRLTPSMIEYLNALIELEFSVIRDEYISPATREVLQDLEIYKKIAYYNIVSRAEKLLQENGVPAVAKGTKVVCYGMSYLTFLNLEAIDESYKTNHELKTGIITLTHITRDEKLHQKQKEHFASCVESLKNNPYQGISISRRRAQQKEMDYYNRMLTNLTAVDELTEQDQKHIEKTTRANEILLRDYDITSFDKETTPESAYVYEKTLEKSKNGFIVKDNIRYL